MFLLKVNQSTNINSSYTDQEWGFLISMIKEAGSLNDKEMEFIYNSYAVKLIIFTANLSDCKHKHRVITCHLLTLVSAAFRTRPLFYHKPGETIENRLLSILNFPGGNPDAVKAGMILLSLLSLNDHLHDLKSDHSHGKYNPLKEQMDYKAERIRLVNRFLNLPIKIKKEFNKFYRGVFENWWVP